MSDRFEALRAMVRNELPSGPWVTDLFLPEVHSAPLRGARLKVLEVAEQHNAKVRGNLENYLAEVDPDTIRSLLNSRDRALERSEVFRKALLALLDLVSESEGVAGYAPGKVVKWEDFGAVHIARSAIAGYKT